MSITKLIKMNKKIAVNPSYMFTRKKHYFAVVDFWLILLNFKKIKTLLLEKSSVFYGFLSII